LYLRQEQICSLLRKIVEEIIPTLVPQKELEDLSMAEEAAKTKYREREVVENTMLEELRRVFRLFSSPPTFLASPAVSKLRR
jgi:DNA/RNA-binding domain of Phe-tRNA-synthetase-like protein